ncbi:unnamed protein product [Paramecium sonneborni]|uniref:Uncharacterized protein n=1 Tax=Paramecium sonneborni TaxID=65129 RepID=A0A8S1QE39_9CILI|nr:unnamed protein product [Paramecium sonneborni]
MLNYSLQQLIIQKKCLIQEEFYYYLLYQQERLDFNSPECHKYLEKFGTVDNKVDLGASKIAFTGDVSLENANYKIKIRYSDYEQFNDAQFYGLVEQDGKPLEKTCLDMKLYHYTSEQYKDKREVTTFKITPFNNYQNNWRYYCFKIKLEEFSQYLIQTQNSNQNIYNGYFAIAYYAAETDQLHYTFFFQFSIINDRFIGILINTFFQPFSAASTLSCIIEECTAKPDTKLNWCKDLTCSEFLIFIQMINLYYNRLLLPKEWKTIIQLILKYGILEMDFKKRLILYIVSFNNNIKGQIILQLKAEIVWSEKLNLRLLQQNYKLYSYNLNSYSIFIKIISYRQWIN